MAEVSLQAERREASGKGPARRARADGKIPAVLYGRGLDPIPLVVERRMLALALSTDAGLNVLLDIQVDGGNTLALTKELQRDPVKGTLLHADFVKVDRKKAVDVEIPVHLVGAAPGVAEGGVLEQPFRMLHIRCLPLEVPEGIEADISSLNIGDSLRVADLPDTDKFEVLSDPDAVVASVAAPITEEQLEAMEAAVAEEAVTEVEEGEVPAEAEAAAEAEGEAPAEVPEGEAQGPPEKAQE